MVNEPTPNLLLKPSLEEAVTAPLAAQLLIALGVQITGLALALTEVSPLIVTGLATFGIGTVLYVRVELRVADAVYPRHRGIFDLRVCTVLRFQLLTLGVARAVRVLRDGRRANRS